MRPAEELPCQTISTLELHRERDLSSFLDGLASIFLTLENTLQRHLEDQHGIQRFSKKHCISLDCQMRHLICVFFGKLCVSLCSGFVGRHMELACGVGVYAYACLAHNSMSILSSKLAFPLA